MKAVKQRHKKLLSLILAFALVLSVFSIMPFSASAAIGDTAVIDGITYTVTSEIYGSNTVSVTGFDNSTKDVVIPEKITLNGNDYSVTAIIDTVFQGNTDIISINIPGTVKVTNPNSFMNCSSLKNITLNEGIEDIVASTFQGTAVEEIKLPKSLTTIRKYAFNGCLNLKDVYIYSDLNILTSVFYKSTAIENVYCYGKNTSYHTSAFKNTNNSLIMHGYAGSTTETFANSKGYSFVEIQEEDSTTEPVPTTQESTEVTDPVATTEPSTEEPTEPTAPTTATEATEEYTTEPVPTTEEPSTQPETTTEEPSTEPVPTTEPDTSIFKWKAIYNNTAVEINGLKDDYLNQVSVEIPDEINGLPVTVIGESAFERGQVMYLTIPASVIVIDNNAFRDCSNLTTVTIAENSKLQKIGNEAFYRTNGGGDSLNAIDLPESLKLLGYRAFFNRANLLTVKIYSKDVYFGDAAKGSEVFDLYSGTSNIKLYGFTGSTAEAYAAQKGHSFRYLDLNTDELQELYNKAAAIDAGLYTQESYANLSDSMKAAKKMLANRDATPAQIEECIADLQAAIDGLVIYVATSTEEPSTAEPTTAPIEYMEYVMGDADGNGRVSILDATCIQKHIVELIKLTGKDLAAADINGDGLISILDVTLMQNWIVGNENDRDYKIGELVQTEVIPTQPETQPTTEPTPPSDITFYVPNYVSWLTDMGGKMWLYNDATAEFTVMDYDEEENCFFIDIPENWSELSLYRTPYETTEEEFDINSSWDEDTQTGVILNKWVNLGSRGENNCYKIIGDGEGLYTTYDPYVQPDDERTIYFDNSKTKWSTVYIYGWSFGIYNEFIQMEPEGNDIWSYTFYDNLPIDGVKGFLFVNGSSWSGATQTGDLCTEEGKNLFVPTPGGSKISGKWDVYTP